jgi:Putative prokaryotic signal transducing protein
MESEKLVLVATYGTRAEAELAKGALEDAGIPAMVQADTAGKMREHLAWSGPGFRVLVRETDLPSANEFLNAAIDWSDVEFPDENAPRTNWRRFT